MPNCAICGAWYDRHRPEFGHCDHPRPGYAGGIQSAPRRFSSLALAVRRTEPC